jgi:hypothetical protein
LGFELAIQGGADGLKNENINSNRGEGSNWKQKTPALTDINTASSVHKYHSAFPAFGHPTDYKNCQEQRCEPVLHSYPFSEMAENIMFDSMLGYY